MELLNPNIVFSKYTDNKLIDITAQDLFSNRRILICSVVRPRENLDQKYADYIQSLIPFYKQHGVDDVYLINSSAGKFGLVRLEKNHPQITSLYDNNADFVRVLATQLNKKPTVDILSKYWSYQILVNNGKVEQFYEQPTENYIKHIIDAGYKIDLGNHKFFALEGDRALHRPSLRVEEQQFEHINIEQKHLITGAIMYFNLWPNNLLYNYLKSV